jgi:hypothetical protein
VQVAGAAWHAVMRIVARDLVQRIGHGRTSRILGGRVIERLGGAVSVYAVHVETRSAGFLVEPQNKGRRFVSGLTSKLVRQFLIDLGLKIDGDGLSMV